MKTKHTPGPWEVFTLGKVAVGVGTRINSKGRKTNVFTMIGNTVDLKDTSKDVAVINANAQLISAAPDLLAACQTVASIIKQYGPGILAGPTQRAIQAAINKATGEKS